MRHAREHGRSLGGGGPATSGGGASRGAQQTRGEGRTTGTHTIKYIWYKTIEELLDGSVKEIINLLEFHQLNGLLGPI